MLLGKICLDLIFFNINCFVTQNIFGPKTFLWTLNFHNPFFFLILEGPKYWFPQKIHPFFALVFCWYTRLSLQTIKVVIYCCLPTVIWWKSGAQVFLPPPPGIVFGVPSKETNSIFKDIFQIGGREVNMINTLSKINMSKIGWEGGGQLQFG